MGTRGLLGFHIDGRDIGSYNHSDSYPSGLGATTVAEIIEAIKQFGLDGVRDRVRKLAILEEHKKPTPEQIDRLRQYADCGVSDRSLEDAYCLLHNLQGSILKILEAGAILENTGFVKDSLFCEWAYFINLDAETFEVYRGFQQDLALQKGRFAEPAGENGYYPCTLVAEYPLNDIPQDWVQRVDPQDE